MADCGIGEALKEGSGTTFDVSGSGSTLLVDGWAADVEGWVDDSETPCLSGIAGSDEPLPDDRVTRSTFFPVLMKI
jgi:hypothetical protein